MNDIKINNRNILIFSIFFVIFTIALFVGLSSADNIVGNNYRNVTVRTSVNITNARPEVVAVHIYQGTNNSMRNITLSGGLTRQVTCNATLRDWNGYGDINLVNATLFHVLTSTYDAADNNNSHYTNTSCTDSGNGLNYTVNYLCVFDVLYYANNGTWNCTVNVKDLYNKTNNNSNTTIVYPIYALNVTDGIDYGQVAVEEISSNITANVTNFGNMAINVSVEGYGAAKGDNLGLVCNLGGNISVGMQRFSSTPLDWDSKMILSSTAQHIPGLTMVKQTVPSVPIVNSTYWQLYVNVSTNPGGNCSGYIIFSAELP